MINWGALQQGGGFQNALATGLQLGQMARQRQDQRDERNALSAFATNPNDQTAAAVAPFQPQLAYRYGQDKREAATKAQIGQLAQQALAGNNDALAQLFTLDNDLWKRLDDRQRQGVKDATTFMAQRGMEIGRLPEEQRSQAWAASVRQAEASGIDIPAYMEAYTPEVLNAALARAEMTTQYIKQFEPDWQPLGVDQVFVNTRDPAAVAQFARGGARGNVSPVAEKTIGGTTYVQDENGDWYVKGGAASNGSGNF